MSGQVSINQNDCEMQVAHTAWGPDMEWHGIISNSDLPHGCVYDKINRTVKYNENAEINNTTTQILINSNNSFVFCHTEKRECNATQVNNENCCQVLGGFADWNFDHGPKSNHDGFSNGFHQGGNFIHFKVKDSHNCDNGPGKLPQWGKANATITFTKNTSITMRWKMAGEPNVKWDSMHISLTSTKQTVNITDITPLECQAYLNENVTYSCAMCQLEGLKELNFQENETVVIKIHVTTTDSLFHQDAFFEVSFHSSSSNTACDGCVCSPQTVYQESCTVTAYEHWAPNITGSESWATDRLRNASADKAWKRDSPTEPLPTGNSKQVNGTGMFRLGALETLASSFRVSGKCCEAWTWSSSTKDGACASGKSTSPIRFNNQDDHPGHPGVVTPEFQLDKFGIANDDIECVQVKQSFCEDVSEHLNNLGTTTSVL